MMCTNCILLKTVLVASARRVQVAVIISTECKGAMVEEG